MAVDVGFGATFNLDFRLHGLDTPERGRPGYREATARANELAPVGAEVTAYTFKADKYGRYLVVIGLPNGDTVNQTLIDEGLAVPYFGGTKGT